MTKYRILVAEDEPELRELYKLRLEAENFSVVFTLKKKRPRLIM